MEVRDERTPPRVAHALLNVFVSDMNDNAPVFVNQPYYAIVSIDAVKGDVVKRVGTSLMVISYLINVCRL